VLFALPTFTSRQLSGAISFTPQAHPGMQAPKGGLSPPRSGPMMFARIGIMRALNRGHVREFNPDRKDTHWGRRKLKRYM
jgi:hypothetical protein